MTTTLLSPFPVFHQDSQGQPASGYKLFTYAAGTTTKQSTYTDSTGGTHNTNPVILDSNGNANVWLDTSLSYKFEFALPTDTDPPTSPIWTVDNMVSPITAATLATAIAALGTIPTLAGNNTFSGNNTYAGTEIFDNSPIVPTPGTTDDSTKAVNSLWVRTLGAAYQDVAMISLASSATLANSSLGGVARFTAASVTATLPPIVAVTYGQTMTFLGGAYGGTIKGNASETITSMYGASANTLAVASGEVLALTGNATGWFVASDGASSSALSVGGYTSLKIATQGSTNFTSAVTAGSIVLSSAAGGVYVAKTVSVSPAINASGPNGLDTGTLAGSTWYYVWVIYNPATATVAGLFSLSATAPTLPTGYTYSARVGAVRTDASGSKYLLQTLQYGRVAQYVVTSGDNVAAMPPICSGTTGSPSTPTWSSFSVSSVVPPTAYKIRISVLNASTGALQVAPNNSYGAYTSTTNPPPVSFSNYSYSNIAEFVLESTNIYYASADASGGVFCMGWEDGL